MNLEAMNREAMNLEATEREDGGQGGFEVMERFCPPALPARIENVNQAVEVACALRQIKALAAKVSAFLRPLKQAADKAKAEILAREKESLGPLMEAERKAKELLEDFVGRYRGEDPLSLPGVSVRTIWRARVVDPDSVPREFLCPDLEALNAYARVMKQASSVPGVEFYSQTILAASADGNGEKARQLKEKGENGQQE